MRAKDAVGRYGERLAGIHLERVGLTVLDRNWRCDLGEVDLVAVDSGCLVVVEVKTRRSLEYGHPAEAVTAAKQARLRRLAARWLAERGTGTGQVFGEVRIDVVAVLWPRTGPAQLQHLRGVC